MTFSYRKAMDALLKAGAEIRFTRTEERIELHSVGARTVHNCAKWSVHIRLAAPFLYETLSGEADAKDAALRDALIKAERGWRYVRTESPIHALIIGILERGCS